MESNLIKVLHGDSLSKRDYPAGDGRISRLNELRNFMRHPKFRAIGSFGNQKYGAVSARVHPDSNLFLISAENTQDLNRLEQKHYPFVHGQNKDKNVIFSEGIGDFSPGIEALIHLGIYLGNKDINYIAHGQYTPLYLYGLESGSIIPESMDSVGKMLTAVEQGRFSLGYHHIAVRESEPHEFYAVGEDVDEIILNLSNLLNKLNGESMVFFSSEISKRSLAFD